MINLIQPYTALPKEKKVKIYTALITQTGTNDPTAIELQNTLGTTIIWTRLGPGQYIGTAPIPIFEANKTAVWTPNQVNFGWSIVYSQWGSEQVVSLIVRDQTSGGLSDGQLLNLTYNIKIYNL